MCHCFGGRSGKGILLVSQALEKRGSVGQLCQISSKTIFSQQSSLSIISSAITQGILETEVCFHRMLLPQLRSLSCPKPKIPKMVFGDYQTPGREILLVEDLTWQDFKEPRLEGDGLDFDHALMVVEWLAKFHGLSFVVLQKHEGGADKWVLDNPWIRHQEEDIRLRHGTSLVEASDIDDESPNQESQKARLLAMAANTLKTELSGQQGQFQDLFHRQNWFDDLRKVRTALAMREVNVNHDFFT